MCVRVRACVRACRVHVCLCASVAVRVCVRVRVCVCARAQTTTCRIDQSVGDKKVMQTVGTVSGWSEEDSTNKLTTSVHTTARSD